MDMEKQLYLAMVWNRVDLAEEKIMVRGRERERRKVLMVSLLRACPLTQTFRRPKNITKQKAATGNGRCWSCYTFAILFFWIRVDLAEEKIMVKGIWKDKKEDNYFPCFKLN